MYHIKDDKRARKSADLIYQGLSELIEKKSFDSITITDIQKTSGIGRATFYRSFDNINDILYWQCAARYQEVMNGYMEEREKLDGPEDPCAFLTYFFNYWMHGDNSRILEQLIKIGHYDIIYRCHFESTFIIKNRVPPKNGLAEKYYTYYMSGLIGAFVGFLVSWIENGKKLSTEELIGLLRSLQGEGGTEIFL
ncbi:MAG: TetR-like C-terminal domain-containing protein [Anaerovoracaceae bacterium]|jgi:AcrR family transcriptional regulator